MKRPYQERILSENVALRKFSKRVQPSQLVWHRDRENRIIEVLSGEGWLFQRDNKLPVMLEAGDRIRVRVGEYHRLIKGDEDLYVKIYKEGKKKKKLSAKQKKLARVAKPFDQITGDDFQSLRTKKDVDEAKKKKKTDFDPGGQPQYRANRTKKQIDKQADLTRKYNAATTEKQRQKYRDKIDKSREKEGVAESSHVKIDPDILREYIEELVEEQKLYAALDEVAAIEEEEADRLYELSDVDDLGDLDERRKKRRKKRKKRKKRKSAGRTLSKAVKKSLDKKADRRCLTRGSVYAEFRAGLGAYYSSGSRKGMAPHQWAHARVNSANPSKSWAKVKKRKKCPKKKK